MHTYCPEFVLNEAALADGSVPLFDVIQRPNKHLFEYTTKELGDDGEHLACAYLMRKGYTVLECNWRSSFGEIDIVAKDPEGELVLVEVKTSRAKPDSEYILPELNVSKKKQEKYFLLAQHYLKTHPDFTSVRFDVIAIVMAAKNQANLRHLINSFSVDGQ